MEEAPFQTKKRRPERIFTAENERNLTTGCLPFRFCGPKSGFLPGPGADFMWISIHAEVLFSRLIRADMPTTGWHCSLVFGSREAAREIF